MAVGEQLAGVFNSLSRVEDADAELMLRFRAGDSACFDAIVARQRRPLLRYLYRMVPEAAVCEELAQETFLRVYMARQRYQPQARFTTWLYRIATHLALNYLRDNKHQRHTRSLDQPVGEDEGRWELPDRQPGIEARLVGEEERGAIRRAIQALPERQRAAVLMHKYQEMDYREIGAVLRLSPSATKSLLFRAYETLRRELRGVWQAEQAASAAGGARAAGAQQDGTRQDEPTARGMGL